MTEQADDLDPAWVRAREYMGENLSQAGYTDMKLVSLEREGGEWVVIYTGM